MKALLSGLIVGALVFFVLLIVFASGTGQVELLLWVFLAVVSGVVTMVLVGRGGTRKT